MARGPAQIIDLFAARRRGRRVAGERLIGGADQRKIALERNGENNPPIGGLQDVSAIVIVKSAHHDVTALVEPRAMLRLTLWFLAQHGLCEYFAPGSGGVDEDSGGHDIALTARDENKPPALAAL